MGWLDKIFPNRNTAKKEQLYNQFKTMNSYTPIFNTYEGGIYEMELTRSAIHSFATAVSKLKPEFVTGEGKKSPYEKLGKKVQFKANDTMVTSQFLYRLATILSVNTTAFIIPVYKEDGETIDGYYPLLPQDFDVVEDSTGELWLRYTFNDGTKAAIEYDRVGVITQFQFKSDFFGDGNGPLLPTMNLMSIQRQGMVDAVKQTANIRFMAQLTNQLSDDDLNKAKREFSHSNLSSENDTGVMMYDSRLSDVKQIDSKPYIIDKEQMDLIEKNIYNYFGISEDIIQNKYDENTWNAFYEGKIEPFALQVGLVMTDMTFTENEIAHGNYIMLSSNRLQYASNRTKLQVSTQLLDRGVLSTNQVMDIWNLPHVEGGDRRIIRKEYGLVKDGQLDNESVNGEINNTIEDILKVGDEDNDDEIYED